MVDEPVETHSGLQPGEGYGSCLHFSHLLSSAHVAELSGASNSSEDDGTGFMWTLQPVSQLLGNEYESNRREVQVRVPVEHLYSALFLEE